MESLLGFKESPNGDIAFDQSSSIFKWVPWINWDEWDFVRVSLFSSSPESVASALRRITAWRSRGCLPVVIEVTASIIEIQQKDPFFRGGLGGEAVDSEEMLAMLYSMAIMRLVNGVIEKTRKKNEVSIAEAAGAIGIPRLLIDIRHEGSHRDLPSLHLVRLASVKAVDWLKAYYWELQKNSIRNFGDIATNRRLEIEHKLHELAFCLRAKKTSRLGSSLVKGKRVNHIERFCGPSKFLTLLTVKHASSKSSGFKKQVNKLLKNVLRLYSSSSGEVVHVLLEILVKALDSSDMVDLSDNQEDSCTAENMLGLWKPVLIKLLNREPELIWRLLKAFLEDLQTQADKCQIDEHLSTFPVAKSHRSEQLVTLFEWLVRNFVNSDSLCVSASQTEYSIMEKNYSKAGTFELLRKCLVTTCHGNHRLMISALALARMIGNKSLISKLEKLLPLSALDLDVDETYSFEGGISESFLSREQEMIDQAAKRLELIKHHCKRDRMEPENSHEKNKRWVQVKSWSPCPIGMLPHTHGSSGCFPILDYSFNDLETPEIATGKDLPGLTQSSCKGVLLCDTDHLDGMNAKNLKDSVEDCEINDLETRTSEDTMGHLIIGGVWKKVKEEELIAITSSKPHGLSGRNPAGVT